MSTRKVLPFVGYYRREYIYFYRFIYFDGRPLIASMNMHLVALKGALAFIYARRRSVPPAALLSSGAAEQVALQL